VLASPSFGTVSTRTRTREACFLRRYYPDQVQGIVPIFRSRLSAGEPALLSLTGP
jgi:hypothetical protein